MVARDFMHAKHLPLLLLSLCLFAEETTDPDMAHVSEAFGHLIYRNFSLLNVPFDIASVIQGIENAAVGKQAKITEEACIAAIYAEQEKNYKLLCQANLKKAGEFLSSNAKEEGIISLKDGKVQYKVISPGKGRAVKDHSAPLVRFAVRTEGGDDLLSNEEKISLDEAISGLKVGLLGMKEGEKRILYVHPDLAYGEKGLSTLYPNTLLVFDIEVLKAN
jgi:peptidylprolyl isomerase